MNWYSEKLDFKGRKAGFYQHEHVFGMCNFQYHWKQYFCPRQWNSFKCWTIFPSNLVFYSLITNKCTSIRPRIYPSPTISLPFYEKEETQTPLHVINNNNLMVNYLNHLDFSKHSSTI